MYITAQLIIDGALDEDVSFDSEKEFDLWFDKLINESNHWRYSSQQWEVFRITHEHPETNECACVQYLTDHHPYWTNKDK